MRVKVTDSGRAQYGVCREGHHDDMVLAVGHERPRGSPASSDDNYSETPAGSRFSSDVLIPRQIQARTFHASGYRERIGLY
jgi:hypothetical protein